MISSTILLLSIRMCTANSFLVIKCTVGRIICYTWVMGKYSLLTKISVYEGRQESQLTVIAESSETIRELQGQVDELKDEVKGLSDKIVSLNEEVEVLSRQRAKLSGECEQYALQVRDLVRSNDAEEAEAATVRAL